MVALACALVFAMACQSPGGRCFGAPLVHAPAFRSLTSIASRAHDTLKDGHKALRTLLSEQKVPTSALKGFWNCLLHRTEGQEGVRTCLVL